MKVSQRAGCGAFRSLYPVRGVALALLTLSVACSSSPGTENSDGGPDATAADGNAPVDAGAPDASHDTGSARDAADGATETALADGAMDAAADAGAADANAADGSAGTTGGFCSGPSTCPAGQVTCGWSTTSRTGICVPAGVPELGCGGGGCQPCNLAHAVASCSGLACAIGSCAAGWADCNDDPSDGCETNLENTTSCGACSTSCAAPTALCAAPGGCAASCTPPLTQCGNTCVNLSTDDANCGACGKACAGTCTGGTCTMSCSDTTEDPNNCGTCGHVCYGNGPGLPICQASSCTVACEPGFTLCFNGCFFTGTDPSNCGACRNTCASGDACVNGACVALTSVWLTTGVSTAPGFAVDDAYVYWTDGSSTVSRIAMAGGSVEAIATGRAAPWGLAVDATDVYWSEKLGGAIWRAPKDGSGSPVLVTAATEPTDIALYQGTLSWIDSSSSVSTVVIGSDGQAPTTVTPQPPNTYSPAPKHLYPTAVGPVVVVTATASAGTGVYVVGVVTNIVYGNSEGGSTTLASDATNLYWSQGDGIEAISLATGQVVANATGTDPRAVGPCGVVSTDNQGGLSLGRVGNGTSVSLWDGVVDQAAIAGDSVYFHAVSPTGAALPTNAIGKLPLP